MINGYFVHGVHSASTKNMSSYSVDATIFYENIIFMTDVMLRLCAHITWTVHPESIPIIFTVAYGCSRASRVQKWLVNYWIVCILACATGEGEDGEGEDGWEGGISENKASATLVVSGQVTPWSKNGDCHKRVNKKTYKIVALDFLNLL